MHVSGDEVFVIGGSICPQHTRVLTKKTNKDVLGFLSSQTGRITDGSISHGIWEAVKFYMLHIIMLEKVIYIGQPGEVLSQGHMVFHGIMLNSSLYTGSHL